MEIVNILIWVMVACKMTVNGAVIDLSYSLTFKSPRYPVITPFNMSMMVRGEQPDGYWLEFNWFSTGEHVGTHIDAPVHFSKTGTHIDEVPLEHLMGPGIVMRAVDEAKKNPDYQITKDFVMKWEAEHGQIPEKAILLMDFGWAVRYKDNDAKLIFNTMTVNDLKSFHFPGLKADAMEFLIKKRKINVIGTDAPSPDYGQSTRYPTHQICSANKIPILENVANLDKLPVTGSHVYAAPLKLQGGSGSPTRLFAIVGTSPHYNPTNVASKTTITMILYTLIMAHMYFNVW